MILNSSFLVFPKRGFINTDFQIISKIDDVNIKIEKGGILIHELYCRKGESLIFSLNEPGEYLVSSSEGEKYSLFVNSARRFGSSILKDTYVFDDLDYSFFVMEDRLKIYDEKKKQFYDANEISPSDIFRFSQTRIILRTESGDNDFVKYALYNLENIDIESEITSSYKDIYINIEKNIFWLEDLSAGDMVLFTIEKEESKLIFKEKERLTDIIRYDVVKENNFLYIENEKSFFVTKLDEISMSDLQRREKLNNVLFDRNGFHYLFANNHLIITNLLFDYHFETNFPNKFSVKYVLYEGGYFEDSDSLENFQSDQQKVEELIYLKEIELIEISFMANHIDIVSIKDAIYNFTITEIDYTIYPVLNEVRVIMRIINKEYRCEYASEDHNKIFVYSEAYRKHEMHTIKKDGIWKLIDESENYFNISYIFPSFIYTDNKIVYEDSELNHFEINGVVYLMVINKDNTCQLYINGLKSSYKGNDNGIDILNLEYLNQHKTIWYKSDEKILPEQLGHGVKHYLSGFNLFSAEDIFILEEESQHSLLKDADEYEFYDKYILSSNKILIHPHTGDIKHAVPGIINSVSNSLNKVISSREHHFYISKFSYENKKYSEVEISLVDDDVQYKEVFLSPEGKHLVYKGIGDEYCFYDYINDKKINFFTGLFLEFSQEGNLIFEEKSQRGALILDPLTKEDITPSKYQYYRFISPDRKFYSQVAISNERLFALDSSKQNSNSWQRFRKSYGEERRSYKTDPNTEENKDEDMIKNRKEFYEKNKILIENYNNKINNELKKIKSWEDINYFNLYDKFLEIGVVGTDKVYDLILPKFLWFYNYAAFSYDSKYFAWVGNREWNRGSGGYIGIYKLNYDNRTKSIELKEEFLSTIAKKATWICGFSKTGYFGTYDSEPITYLLDYENRTDFDSEVYNYQIRNLIKEEGRKNSLLSFTKNGWTLEEGKSFLCFSPLGKYVAMSNNGYDPILSGGVGHLESTMIYIKNLKTNKIVYSDSFHGSTIKTIQGNYYDNRKLQFVAFSEDETKLMTMSIDGVVIVRDIELD